MTTVGDISSQISRRRPKMLFFLAASLMLTMGMIGCGLHRNAPVVAPATPPAPVAMAACPSPLIQKSASASKPRLVAYLFADKGMTYTGYAKSVDFAKMTHLYLAFGTPPKCNGGCSARSNMQFSIHGESDADIRAMVATAHAAGVKVVLSIGGGRGDQKIIQFYNAGLSIPLVASLDKYVANHDFDGVDLDIEDPSNMGAPYAAFVKALIDRFHPEGKIVTAAVAKYLQSSVPDSTLHQFDFINVMNYSSYDSALASLQFYSMQEHVPKNKIVLGVPFFGSNSDDSKEESYKDIMAAYPNAWRVNLSGGGPLDDGQAFNYVGEATMAKETLLGKQYGGVMIWEIAGDAPAPHSLLSVIQSNF